MKRYQEVMQIIQVQINTDVLKPGQRLPSVREMSQRMGYSPVTIHHAYVELEGEGIIVARPRSGFFVAEGIRKLTDFPIDERDFEIDPDNPQSLDCTFYRMTKEWQKSRISNFGKMHLDQGLLPHKGIGAHYLKILRETLAQPPLLDQNTGAKVLREALAQQAGLRGMVVRPQDVFITPSLRNALDLCLEATTEPGDTILVESPSYPPLLTVLQRRRHNVIEIYSHPTYGVDPEQFEYLLDHNNIKACALMTEHHFPTGVSYPEKTIQRILAKATQRNVTIIENDNYGELAQETGTRRTLFHLDDKGIVIQFGSFQEILGSRFGLGWVLSRNRHSQLGQLHFFNAAPNGADAMQSAIAEFMMKRSYERHLRRLRETLTSRVRRGLNLISQLFPQECSASKPDGGFMCWVRAPRGFNSIAYASRAKEMGISYVPGPIFSVTGSFKDFLAINLSCEWSSTEVENLQKLARLLDYRNL